MNRGRNWGQEISLQAPAPVEPWYQVSGNSTFNELIKFGIVLTITKLTCSGDQGTLVSLQDSSSAGTFVNHSTGPGDMSDGTMINHSTGNNL